MLLWLAFFDSHSVLRRTIYASELGNLRKENEALRAENKALNERIDAGLTPGVAETIAREQYGMRRPGETVYRVKADGETESAPFWEVP